MDSKNNRICACPLCRCLHYLYNLKKSNKN